MLSAHRITRAASTWFKYVLYVDRGVVILNKPPGLVCQGAPEDTLDAQTGSSHGFNDLLDDLKSKFSLSSVPYQVHRLDKGTTGSLVLARTPSLARELSQQFQSREVEKTYLALVRGGSQSFLERSGRIQAPLKFVNGRPSIGSPENGKIGETDWELVTSSTKAPVSLVRLRPRTGLKHQLRVHLAHLLHTPILGDELHTSSRVSRTIRAATELCESRMFLHASHLSFFRYRKSGPSKRFRFGISAPLPRDFLKVCSDLGIGVHKDDVQGGLFMDGQRIEDGEISEVDGHRVNFAGYSG